jgi:hypothetical protein
MGVVSIWHYDIIPHFLFVDDESFTPSPDEGEPIGLMISTLTKNLRANISDADVNVVLVIGR